MKGSIAKIDHAHQRGELRGANGKTYPFEREGMVLWLQFDTLQPGTPVTFDLEGTNRVINVERVK